jgi:phytoene desaturase
MQKKILVVGAGIAGMAAAIRLARAGHWVEVWEKNETPGGKLKALAIEGFTWGTGPSLLTMPQILQELFKECGAKLADYLTLVRLDSACQYVWGDGTIIQEDEAFWKRPEVASFLKYAKGIYELSSTTFLRYPPNEFWRALIPQKDYFPNPLALRHIGKIATRRSLAAEVKKRFRDPHLQQIFFRFATYNGSNPYAAPATFNLIPYVEAEFGAWYVKGGMPEISNALVKLAIEQGVKFCYSTQVTNWDGSRATTYDGHAERFDLLVCNGDVITSRHQFLSSLTSPAKRDALLKPALSTSGFVLFLGVRDFDPRLGLHNIFFSNHYPRECSELHSDQLPPVQPTIYVSVTSRMDPSHAPEACDNYFVLVNVPARDPAKPWTVEETKAFRDVIVARLEQLGLEDLNNRIMVERAFTPTDFAARDLAWHGSLYGWASNSPGTALFRPPIHDPTMPSVYFTGGTTHPGGGIPLVLTSAKMVSEMILRKYPPKQF